MEDFDILTNLAKEALRECQLASMPWYKRIYYRITNKSIKSDKE